ncbi:MAG: hypothetical protein KY475_02940 [Planctomycetes bacterium]|nr:hypothetical protein [Planctomycetota bacterium]
MKKFLLATFRFLICFIACYALPPALQSADAIRPVTVVQVDAAETWIGELSANQGPTWVIRHAAGLRKVNLASGDVSDIPMTNQGALRNSTRSRFISPNGKTFAYSADGEGVTFAHVDDGGIIARADSKELFGHRAWPYSTYLSEDGTYCICLDVSNGGTRLSRVDLIPTARVAASQQLPRVHDLIVEDRGMEWVVVAPPGQFHRGARFLQLFDRDLRLVSKQELHQPWFVSAIGRYGRDSAPLVLLNETRRNVWQVVGYRDGRWATVCSGPLPAQHQWRGMVTATISPDSRWLVVSPMAGAPTLAVWSVREGALKRVVHLEGGVHELPTDGMILRIVFSLSGEFLAASDKKNAYLLRFAELVEDDSGSTRRQSAATGH